MEIKFKFIGPLKFEVGGRSIFSRDVPEGSTVEDALRVAGMDCKNTASFNFAVVNGEKVEPDHVLSPDDEVKVFPRSFGG
ncbi:MAG: MoaD/ThiS family protein [Clostridiales Family XIII bacterium]|jgi:molybdopterin converting factor small subunit|nr:MoaD/ThiS family protein [Clostridiales Family XIII bacterium]